jgi:hypothetical protein
MGFCYSIFMKKFPYKLFLLLLAASVKASSLLTSAALSSGQTRCGYLILTPKGLIPAALELARLKNAWRTYF